MLRVYPPTYTDRWAHRAHCRSHPTQTHTADGFWTQGTPLRGKNVVGTRSMRRGDCSGSQEPRPHAPQGFPLSRPDQLHHPPTHYRSKRRGGGGGGWRGDGTTPEQVLSEASGGYGPLATYPCPSHERFLLVSGSAHTVQYLNMIATSR